MEPAVWWLLPPAGGTDELSPPRLDRWPRSPAPVLSENRDRGPTVPTPPRGWSQPPAGGCPYPPAHLLGGTAQVGDHCRLPPARREGIAIALSRVVGGKVSTATPPTSAIPPG